MNLALHCAVEGGSPMLIAPSGGLAEVGLPRITNPAKGFGFLRENNMRIPLVSHLKPVVLGLLALVVLGFSAGVTKAEEVTISGYSNACFNCNPPPVPNTSAVQMDNLLGLTYVNSTFSN